MAEPDHSVQELTRSIWFPIGRANFYSYSSINWLDHQTLSGADSAPAIAKYIADERYTPLLQVSVLRRVLEVLPRSFGYHAQGTTTLSDTNGDRHTRPRAVRLTLVPAASIESKKDCPEVRANLALRKAGVRLVRFRVDEDGFYVFTARPGPSIAASAAALDRHVEAVFGGSYSLQWQTKTTLWPVPEPVDDDAFANVSTERAVVEAAPLAGVERDAPGRVYNGIPEGDDDTGPHLPRGILTFFQLNTLFEGVFNDALTPVVFLERQDASGESALWWKYSRATAALDTVGHVVRLLRTDLDARDPNGRIITLRHFLAVTSRESLQKLKWSVESVRRGLLEEMMGILHRRSRLNQLRLDKSGPTEYSRELATGANESQLRGYVMLAGAKLPLIANLERFARTAAQPLRRTGIATDRADLGYRLEEWSTLLNALTDNIRGLEKAVEHAWMERLLYEQEQARAEQEAMAEIERTRNNRPAAAHPSGGGGSYYSALMLFATVIAAFIGFATLGQVKPDVRLLDQLPLLLTLLAAAVGVSLVPLLDVWRRHLLSRRRSSQGYGYEFAFRLDRVVDAGRVQEYASYTPRRRGDPYRDEDKRVASNCRSLRRLDLDRTGGVRIEYASRDSTLVKVHAVVRFRTRQPGRWFDPRRLVLSTARFEVINEFLARSVSGEANCVLRESRMFGDSPRVLTPTELLALVTFVLKRSALILQVDQDEDAALREILANANEFFGTGTTGAAPHAKPAVTK